MRKSIYRVLALVFVLGALFVPGGIKEAVAEVNVNINIGPPPIVVPEPPEVVFIPPIGVYFVPQVDFDVFFYRGYCGLRGGATGTGQGNTTGRGEL